MVGCLNQNQYDALAGLIIIKLSPMGYGMSQMSFIKINRQSKIGFFSTFKQEGSICI